VYQLPVWAHETGIFGQISESRGAYIMKLLFSRAIVRQYPMIRLPSSKFVCCSLVASVLPRYVCRRQLSNQRGGVQGAALVDSSRYEPFDLLTGSIFRHVFVVMDRTTSHQLHRKLLDAVPWPCWNMSRGTLCSSAINRSVRGISGDPRSLTPRCVLVQTYQQVAKRCEFSYPRWEMAHATTKSVSGWFGS